MDNTAPITVIKRRNVAEPPRFVELFKKLQARYRTLGVHTPEEWPMNKPQGRRVYVNSQQRARFLATL